MLHLSPLLPQPLATTDLSSVSIVLPFPECHILGIINHVAFSDWLLPFSNMPVSFLSVFSWLDSSCFFHASSPLSGCSIVCLSIHMLKAILVDSKFWQLWIKLLEASMCRFLCEHKFSTLLDKYQGLGLLTIYFFKKYRP